MTEVLRDGRFVALAPLGEGSQGRTYDGIDKREGRPVAIKRFDVRGAKGWKDVELAEREARVLASLSHPKLPAYVDHFEHDGALYLVMEKIEGESLANLRKRGGVLGEEDVMRLLRDAADVLEYLHTRAPAVIHRDLKPGNVIRRPDGSFAFVDFGAVRDKLKPEGGSTVVGTFGYMAPEQFQGRALPASDVYAIGATAITLLTGEEPENLPHKGLAIDVRAALRGRASETMINLLEQMLDPDPDRRASKLGPLLGRKGRESEKPKRGEDWHERLEREAVAFNERIEREAKEFEQRVSRDPQRARQQKRDRRAQRIAQRRARPIHPWPKPLALVANLAIMLAAAVTWIAMYHLTAGVLGLLSIMFGPKLVDAGNAVRRAAVITVAAMRGARELVMHGFAPPRDEERVRVRVAGEPPRARVAEEDELDEDEAEEPEKRRKKV